MPISKASPRTSNSVKTSSSTNTNVNTNTTMALKHTHHTHTQPQSALYSLQPRFSSAFRNHKKRTTIKRRKVAACFGGMIKKSKVPMTICCLGMILILFQIKFFFYAYDSMSLSTLTKTSKTNRRDRAIQVLQEQEQKQQQKQTGDGTTTKNNNNNNNIGQLVSLIENNNNNNNNNNEARHRLAAEMMELRRQNRTETIQAILRKRRHDNNDNDNGNGKKDSFAALDPRLRRRIQTTNANPQEVEKLLAKLEKRRQDERGDAAAVAALLVPKRSCNELFSTHHFRLQANCVSHVLLSNAKACMLGSIIIDTSKINGSLGGEEIINVLERSEELETLTYEPGALTFMEHLPLRQKQQQQKPLRNQKNKINNISKSFPLPLDTELWKKSYADGLINLLQSGLILDNTTVTDLYQPSSVLSHATNTNNIDNKNYLRASSNNNTSNSVATTRITDNVQVSNTTAILIKRGDYANPCMTILTMYNVFIALQKFGLMDTTTTDTNASNTTTTTDTAPFQQNQATTTKTTFLWLDGHAKGNLDSIWETVFGTTLSGQPYHIRRLPSNQTKFANAIAINTMSVVGTEGYKKYDWRTRTHNTDHCDLNPNNNTLVQFRNYILHRFGIQRKTITPSFMPTTHVPLMDDYNNTNHHHYLPPLQQQQQPEQQQQPQLTFLVRRDYVAHPRSNGRTDRVLANLTLDIEYIQSLHPEYNMTVISFESMSFYEQLYQISQTDLLVSVHGAGNIHALFLPNHATFIEYLPKTYQKRMRFRFLAECLNLTYIAKQAWVVEKFDGRSKVSVQLKPRSESEEHRALWHTGMKG